VKQIITAISSMTATFSQKKCWAIWFLMDLWRFKLWYVREILGEPNNQNQTLKTMFQGDLEDFVLLKITWSVCPSICISFMVGFWITIQGSLHHYDLLRKQKLWLKRLEFPLQSREKGTKKSPTFGFQSGTTRLSRWKSSFSKRKCKRIFQLPGYSFPKTAY